MILTSGLTVLGLYNSNSSQETLSALSFVPVALFFGLTTFKRQYPTESADPAVTLHPRLNKLPKETAIPKQKADIADIDKRVFLKLVGATGLSFFLFSIFNKRTQTPLFGNTSELGTTSLIDINGKKIDPPEKTPTDGYTISEIDDDTIAFYGFIKNDGAWYIMREDSDTGSIRYVRGDGEFTSNWVNRKQLKYNYFNDVF